MLEREQLEVLYAGIKQATTRMRDISRDTAMKRAGLVKLQAAHDAIAPVLVKLNRRDPESKSLHTNLSFVLNKISSLHSGISDKMVTLDVVRTIRSQVIASLTELGSNLNEQLGTYDFNPSLAPVKVNEVVSSDKHLDDLEREVKEATQESIGKVPKAGTKKFVVLRLPIIPLFDPLVSTSDLVKSGFKVKQIGLYPILEEQLVVAVPEHFTANPMFVPKQKLKVGTHVVVTPEVGSDDAFWMATIKKVKSSSVMIEYYAGDTDELDPRCIVGLIDEGSIKKNQKEGITKPLTRNTVNKYVKETGLSIYDPVRTAERVIDQVIEKSPSLRLAETSSDSPFVRNAKLPGYRLYWLVDQRSLARLQSKTKVIITEWNLSVSS